MFEVSLSTTSIDSRWGSSSLAYNENGAAIHIADTIDTPNTLQTIQRSGRVICSAGVSAIRLVGDWSAETQFHFWQGAYHPKNIVNIEYAKLSTSDMALLENRVRVHTWARNLVNETPENLSPTALVEKVCEFIASHAPDYVSSKIIRGDELNKLGYVGIYEVGRGSDRSPALLELDYCPEGCENSPPAASLVGKGITFDSGGYSLKQTLGMLHMKADMGGAATVAGALSLAILNGLNQRVKLYLCCAENLVSGHSYKLSDILSYRNGVSVEVVNTDAEGRLVLADGLINASLDEPKMIIDAATLTGAAHVAMGEDYNALFCMDDELAAKFELICKNEYDLCWRLPLSLNHQTKCPSDYADTANSRPVAGGGPGGASNAAGFLSRFVSCPEKRWVHLDLAACYSKSSNDLWSAGGTGRGIRGIAALLIEEN